MRLLCFLFLVAFAGVVFVFAQQNQQEVSLKFFDWSVAGSIAVVVGVTYALGMLSGWTVVGMLRRSLNRTSEMIEERVQAPVR